MKGDPRVIEVLNEILTAELTAVNQYFIHAKMCANWGYLELASYTKSESIDEMKHAEWLIDRILLLDGVPNMQRYFKLKIGKSVKEQFENDLALEVAATERNRKAIAICTEANDPTSRMLVERIQAEEEHHIDWLETQLRLIEELGVENYLVTKVGKTALGHDG
jgi:bacterioferritin